jgi:hypothetical protein
MKLRVALATSLALLFAVPTAAGAALPKAKSDLIVPSHSIGGLVLGSNPGQVKAAWGGKTCEFSCAFQGPKVSGGSPAYGNVLLEKKGSTLKVWQIAIAVGFVPAGAESKPEFNTPLAAFKTSKGIGLGSKVSELEAAYPKAKKTKTPNGPFFSLQGPGLSATNFNTIENRVSIIAVESHSGG